MKKSLNKKTFCLTAAALTLTAGLSVGSAMAYFTSHTEAAGGKSLDLGFTTTIPDETVENWTKHITIQNTGDYDCYVRVKVFAGEKYQDGLEYSDDSGKWAPGADGYYYYDGVISPEGKTDVLRVHIDHMDSEESFNVIVVQECTPVLYDEDGNPYADWDAVVTSSQESYTGADEEVGE